MTIARQPLIGGHFRGTAGAEALTAYILTRISNPDILTLVRTSIHQSKTAMTRVCMRTLEGRGLSRRKSD